MTAGAATAVVAVLPAGAWLVLGGAKQVQAGNAVPGDVVRTTELSSPPDPSDGSSPPRPFPTVPSAQVRGQHVSPWGVRTGSDGRQLLVQLMETDCSSEEVRLLGEHADRVEVELRTVAKPPAAQRRDRPREHLRVWASAPRTDHTPSSICVTRSATATS